MVKQGPVAGSAHLVGKSAGHRAAYDWQYSTDQKIWSDAPTSLQAKATVLGLVVGTTYYFRFRSVLKAGPGNWSQVVSLLVQ